MSELNCWLWGNSLSPFGLQQLSTLLPILLTIHKPRSNIFNFRPNLPPVLSYFTHVLSPSNTYIVHNSHQLQSRWCTTPFLRCLFCTFFLLVHLFASTAPSFPYHCSQHSWCSSSTIFHSLLALSLSKTLQTLAGTGREKVLLWLQTELVVELACYLLPAQPGIEAEAVTRGRSISAFHSTYHVWSSLQDIFLFSSARSSLRQGAPVHIHFLRFSLRRCQRATTVAPNHFNIINATHSYSITHTLT